MDRTSKEKYLNFLRDVKGIIHVCVCVCERERERERERENHIWVRPAGWS